MENRRKLSKEKMVAFDHLLTAGYAQTRMLCRDTTMSNEEKIERIARLSQAMHNIPHLISENEVDAEHILSDLAELRGTSCSYIYERAKEILE